MSAEMEILLPVLLAIDDLKAEIETRKKDGQHAVADALAVLLQRFEISTSSEACQRTKETLDSMETEYKKTVAELEATKAQLEIRESELAISNQQPELGEREKCTLEKKLAAFAISIASRNAKLYGKPTDPNVSQIVKKVIEDLDAIDPEKSGTAGALYRSGLSQSNMSDSVQKGLSALFGTT